MKELKFNVKLNREELAALSVFKPEFREILNKYDSDYDTFITETTKLIGFISFLAKFGYDSQQTKIQTLNNVMNNYFFEDVNKKFISNYILDTNDFCIFFGCLSAIGRMCVWIILEGSNVISDDEFKKFLKHELDKILDLRLE